MIGQIKLRDIIRITWDSNAGLRGVVYGLAISALIVLALWSRTGFYIPDCEIQEAIKSGKVPESYRIETQK